MKTSITGDGWAGLSLAILLKDLGETYRIRMRPERKRPHTTGAILERHPKSIDEIIERHTVAEIREVEIRHRGKTATYPIYARMVDPVPCLHEMRKEARSDGDIEPDVQVDATGAKRGVLGVEYTIKSTTVEQKLVFDFNMPPGTGYTWTFGFGENRAKVGMISNRNDARFDTLRAYVKEKYPDFRIIEKMSGTTAYGWTDRVVNGRTAAIGDAAKQVNPVSYEGIRPAIRAAEVLAGAIRNENLAEYQKWHTENIARPYRVAVLANKIVQRTGFPVTSVSVQDVQRIGENPIRIIAKTIIRVFVPTLRRRSQ